MEAFPHRSRRASRAQVEPVIDGFEFAVQFMGLRGDANMMGGARCGNYRNLGITTN